MATKKALIKRALKALKEGDRRPEVVALAHKVKNAPESIVHGYEWRFKFLGI